ncbi:hypothetical protein, partial [Micromonospora sp. NPDC049799]|uniref:hypothetical protein n=1 Tax=Micromonospora sp. NPDC049799 TaxID=3154741 RepID=UPI0033E877D7
MRRIPVLLTALGLLCWLTACSTTDDPRAQPGGCLPELIEHGRTGLLTTDEDELGDLLLAASLL